MEHALRLDNIGLQLKILQPVEKVQKIEAVEIIMLKHFIRPLILLVATINLGTVQDIIYF
jgi:hypothetical protein